MVSVAENRRYPVSAEDRLECIDLINRHNLAFDEWDLETLVSIFTEDGVVSHPRGQVKGYEELRAFYDAYYPITLGVRRQAVNHVVDGLPDGRVRVSSYNMLVRVAPSEDDRAVKDAPLTLQPDTFPALSIHALTIDTCRKDEGHGWRICERRAERNVVNDTLR